MRSTIKITAAVLTGLFVATIPARAAFNAGVPENIYKMLFINVFPQPFFDKACNLVGDMKYFNQANENYLNDYLKEWGDAYTDAEKQARMRILVVKGVNDALRRNRACKGKKGNIAGHINGHYRLLGTYDTKSPRVNFEMLEPPFKRIRLHSFGD